MTDIVVRWPGSTHDSYIFNNSRLKRLFEEGRYGNAVLVGDSGYACKSYMMTPLDVCHRQRIITSCCCLDCSTVVFRVSIFLVASATASLSFKIGLLLFVICLVDFIADSDGVLRSMLLDLHAFSLFGVSEFSPRTISSWTTVSGAAWNSSTVSYSMCSTRTFALGVRRREGV